MKRNFETFQEFMAGARKGRPLTNSICRKTMTLTRLQSLILQGYGQGRNEHYVPWMRVTRGNAPRVSHHQVAQTSVHKRSLHLMSALERRALPMATWLGADEVREQFPLLPWEGAPHPMAGLDAQRDRNLPPTPGLLGIAAKAGIKHGSYVGAPDLPYVAQTDLVIRIGHPPHDRLVFWACKPKAMLEDAAKADRIHQRITLERLYAEAVGATLTVFDGTHEVGYLCANLDWLEPRKSELGDPELTAKRNQFAAAFRQTPTNYSVERRIAEAGSSVGMDTAEAQRQFRAAVWMGAFDADLRAPILMSKPLKTDGGEHKRMLRKQLLGGLS